MLNQLNFKEFLVWLSNHDGAEVAGIACNVMACPVAAYATEVHGFSVHFNVGYLGAEPVRSAYSGTLRSLEDELILDDWRFFCFAELLDKQFGCEEVSFANAREIASELV